MATLIRMIAKNHEIKRIRLDELKPAEYNPRRISDSAKAGLKASLDRFGLVQPIVVNKKSGLTVIGGHQRLAVLREQGVTETDVVLVSLTKTEEKALNIALNNRHIEGEWTADLQGLLDELSAEAPDLFEDLRFGDLAADLKALEAQFNDEPTEGLTDPDEVPEEQETVVSEVGDLWILGGGGRLEHRLLCGDSTDPACVARLLGGQKVDMMFTDPPYGVNYRGGYFHSEKINIKHKRENLQNDDSVEIYDDFLPIALKNVDGPCYMWFSDSQALRVYQSVENASGEVHALIIWHKTNATYAAMNAQYKKRHEPCLYFKPKNSNLRWNGPSNECTVWDIARDSVNDLHPTQKPVALAERALKNHSAETVADFFAGSGSTLIASEQLSRKFFGIELEPRFVDVCVRRFQNFTGKKAKTTEGKTLD